MCCSERWLNTGILHYHTFSIGYRGEQFYYSVQTIVTKYPAVCNKHIQLHNGVKTKWKAKISPQRNGPSRSQDRSHCMPIDFWAVLWCLNGSGIKGGYYIKWSCSSLKRLNSEYYRLEYALLPMIHIKIADKMGLQHIKRSCVTLSVILYNSYQWCTMGNTAYISATHNF